jgi:hypothetical protein
VRWLAGSCWACALALLLALHKKMHLVHLTGPMATIPFFLDDVDFQIIHNLEDLISFSSISKIFE